MTVSKLIQSFLLALFLFLLMLAHPAAARVQCRATLCEWIDEPPPPPPANPSAEERIAGLDALRAAFSSIASQEHLGPAVLHPSWSWEKERMPIAVRLEPINDRRIMPPQEFDHDYNGTIIVNRTDDLGIKQQCRQSGTNTACTYPPVKPNQVCFVWIVYDDILNYQRRSYDAVFRHERAHCSGWRHDKFGVTLK